MRQGSGLSLDRQGRSPSRHATVGTEVGSEVRRATWRIRGRCGGHRRLQHLWNGRGVSDGARIVMDSEVHSEVHSEVQCGPAIFTFDQAMAFTKLRLFHH